MKKYIYGLMLIVFCVVLSSCTNGNTYNVTFDTDGGTFVESQVVEKDGTIYLPSTPTKEGYTFVGWYIDDSEIDINNLVITKDTTIYAKWEKNKNTLRIVFNNGEDDLVIEGYTDDPIEEIKIPTRTGYKFLGFSDTIPSIMPSVDKTIYANWIALTYTITIKYNNGLEDTILSGKYGKKVEYPDVTLYKEGYSFDGYDTVLPDTFSSDLTINAKWVTKQTKVTIHYNDERTDLVTTYNYGDTLSIDNPTRDGYVFNGWDKEIPTTIGMDDIELNASWIKLYTLTINYSDDNSSIFSYLKAGDAITLKEKEGYFIENFDSIDKVMIESDLTINVKYICDVTYTINDNEVTITGINKVGNPTILSSYEGATTKYIGENAFLSNTNITSIILPDTITKIGAHAFDKCTNLKKIVLPSNLDYIDEYVFYCCFALNDLILPDNLTYIGDYAFYKTTSLKTIVIPNKVTIIGAYSFYGCTELNNVVIGESVYVINNNAFVNCTKLTLATFIYSSNWYSSNNSGNVQTVIVVTSEATEKNATALKSGNTMVNTDKTPA